VDRCLRVQGSRKGIHSMLQYFSRYACIVLFAALVAGCGSKISQSNFDKIKSDMTRQEVESILGKPTDTSSTDLGIASGGSSTWKDKSATITVQFVNDKVMTKTFSASSGQ
jgi:hypothetical protein